MAPEPEAPAPAPPPARPKEPVEVYIEETPNPYARKFVCSVPVVAKGSLVFNDAKSAEDNPIGKALFAIDGVRTVFATKDFITVTSHADANWRDLQPHIWATLVGVLSS